MNEQNPGDQPLSQMNEQNPADQQPPLADDTTPPALSTVQPVPPPTQNLPPQTPTHPSQVSGGLDLVTFETIVQGLHDESSKRREATINRYSQLPMRDERVTVLLQQIAMNDPVPYVREAAVKVLKSSPTTAGNSNPTPTATAALAAVASTQVVPTAISIDLRRDILSKEIYKYTAQGYRVVSQTDTTAQLVKPKRMSCGVALLVLLISIFTLGILFVLYLIWYIAQKDEQIYLEVDVQGNVMKTSQKG